MLSNDEDEFDLILSQRASLASQEPQPLRQPLHHDLATNAKEPKPGAYTASKSRDEDDWSLADGIPSTISPSCEDKLSDAGNTSDEADSKHGEHMPVNGQRISGGFSRLKSTDYASDASDASDTYSMKSSNTTKFVKSKCCQQCERLILVALSMLSIMLIFILASTQMTGDLPLKQLGIVHGSPPLPSFPPPEPPPPKPLRPPQVPIQPSRPPSSPPLPSLPPPLSPSPCPPPLPPFTPPLLPPALPPQTVADRLNERFTRRDGDASARLEDAGIILHQFDGKMSSSQWWAPCPKLENRMAEDRRYPSYCADERSFLRRHRVSGSIIGGRMQPLSGDVDIPFFSFDAGVILRPNKTTLLCVYGMDGSTDGMSSCDPKTEPQCVPGCGDPPRWCAPDSENDRRCVCGFAQCRGRVQPWMPQDLSTVLRIHANSWAGAYQGPGSYTGYNEAIIDADAWISNLPATIEAIFFIKPGSRVCQERTGLGFAKSCAEAERQARNVHRDLLEYYGFNDPSNALAPGLVMLHPERWEQPFTDV